MESRQAKLSVALTYAVVALWGVLYYDAIASAIRIWYVSEIFSHGFFIIPGALYFIWRERSVLAEKALRPNYWVLPFLTCLVLLGVFGQVGDIQVFSHISAFSALPVAIWFLTGNQVAKVLWFPLCFMLFSIPIGEQLVPYLQKITADLAVTVLKWTSIPSYNSGLYIEIPQGKFVVAEACSGIRFFVGSLVFGAIYSHLSYRSFNRKVAFMFLALIIPVLANALRVFFIVVIGYHSDMEYAVGADHIIYGWVFFSVVLFLLVLVGETFREKPAEMHFESSAEAGTSKKRVSASEAKTRITDGFSKLPVTALAQLLLILTSAILWQGYVQSSTPAQSQELNQELLAKEIGSNRSFYNGWSPVFVGDSDRYRSQMPLSFDELNLVGKGSIDWLVIWYASDAEGGELVASANSLFDKGSWSKVSERNIPLNVSRQGGGQSIDARLLDIVASNGEKRFVLYWYQLDDLTVTSSIKTKLLQSLDLMLGNAGDGAIFMLSMPYRLGYEEHAESILRKRAEKYYEALIDSIPFD